MQNCTLQNCCSDVSPLIHKQTGGCQTNLIGWPQGWFLAETLSASCIFQAFPAMASTHHRVLSLVWYLGLRSNNKLDLRKYITVKTRQVNPRCKCMCWLLDKKSTLSLYYKILIYKIIIRPLCLSCQSPLKILHRMTNVPRCESNKTLHDALMSYASQKQYKNRAAATTWN